MSKLVDLFQICLEASGDQTSRQGDWSPEAKEWGRGQRREGAGRGSGGSGSHATGYGGGSWMPRSQSQSHLALRHVGQKLAMGRGLMRSTQIYAN